MGPGGPMMGGGMDDPGMMTPGGQGPMAGPAMAALDQLSPKSANPTASMQKTDEALNLAYRLITTVISQVQAQNPKVAKDGHAVAKSILTMKSELRDDLQVGAVPDLMLGMGAGGTPSPMTPPSPTGGSNSSGF